MKKRPKSNKQYEHSALFALVNAMIEYWKEIARRNFVKSYPHSDPGEFEQNWPKILASFLLAQTVRTAKALSALSDGRDN
jgi:hypothetical protein